MKKLKQISSLLLITLLTFSSMIMPVSANSSWGDGYKPTVNKVGGWNIASGEKWNGSGSTPAWKAFEKAAGNRHNGSNSDVYKNPKAAVDSLAQGGGGDLTLYEACRRSEHIWWYGESDSDAFYTQIGTNAHPSAENMPYTSIDSRDTFQKFLSTPGNGWNKRRGTVLVCSYSLEAKDIPLTLKSDSDAFEYDGTPKTVEGYKIIAGEVIKGDVLDAHAKSTRTEVGSQNVEFTKKSTVKSTTGTKYKINHQYGKLHIMPEEEDVDNCRTTSSDRVKEITQNDLKVEVGFSGGGGFPGVPLSERQNAAYDVLMGSPPTVGDTISKWKGWKAQFIAGGEDDKTEELDLHSLGLADPMQEHGGVLNITRINWESEVNATFCQPQKRDRIHEVDEDGNVSSYWSDWYDDPAKEEIIESVDRELNKDNKKYSYQILGVNCNADGFEYAKGVTELAGDFSYSGTAGSGLLQTAEREGVDFPLGKGETGQMVFYKPDDVTWKNSCKIFKCKSDVLEGAEHDAKNNLGIDPLFTHKDEADYQNPEPGREKGHGYPEEEENGDVGSLNIFRDNEDREIRADVWYPAETGRDDLIAYPERAANTTRAKIFETSDGGEKVTPEIDITTIAFWTSPADKFNQTDHEYSVGGHVNSFNMKSMWASDENKPYRLGVDWTYIANAVNVGPGVIDGHAMHGTSPTRTFDFEAHCTFNNESGVEHEATIPDHPHSIYSVDADWSDSGRIKSLFTRSVSDRSNTD